MGKTTVGEKIFHVGNITVLLLIGLCTLYPFWYTLTLSFSAPQEANQLSLHLFPKDPTLQAYVKIFSQHEVYVSYRNTIVRTVLGVLLAVMLTTLTAYPLSKRTFPHRKIFMFLLVFSMLFSGGTIPAYLLVKNLHMIDTLWALVLPGAVGAMNVIVMRNYFESIPIELHESAKIDGAGEFCTFRRVALPLSAPAIAVVGLWLAVYYWNEWFQAMLYVNNNALEVLQMYLRRTVLNGAIDQLFDATEMTPESLKSATVMFISAPILFVYPFIQRYFVKGIMLGSVKG